MEYSKERNSKILELFPAQLWSDADWLKPWCKTLAQVSEAQREEYENATDKTSLRTVHVRETRFCVPVAKNKHLNEDELP